VTGTWWRLTISCDPGQSDAIAAAVVDATGNGVEEPAIGTICTTVDTEAGARRLLRDVVEQFGAARGTIARTEAVDWSTRWRDGIVTRAFGRLLLTPSWLPVEGSPAQCVVSIDPESAFGSGEHGSTRGALALLERQLHRGDRVLDLGSGSGILAIAAVKLGARSAIGIEVDEADIPIAEANARKNGVQGMATFLCGDANDLAPLAGPVDLICANILRSVNTLLLPAILRALTAAGVVIFAGMEEVEESLFRPVLAASGVDPIDEVRDAGWWSVAVRRR
jgi:ribosomal protein L11 methyltransferase